MQLSAMRSYARKRGWTVAVEVKDVGSGATALVPASTLKRPERAAL
jgi:hypothetical protein